MAAAADRAFLANNNAWSSVGRAITIGTKTLTLHGTSYSVPCDSVSWGLSWSPHGVSMGSVLGYDVRAVAPNKASSTGSPAGSIKSWTTDASGTAESMASGHLSQLDWVDGTFFVGTAPDKTNCGSNSPELQLWDATLTTPATKQASIVMPDPTDKPEGVDVVQINAGNRGSCGASAGHSGDHDRH